MIFRKKNREKVPAELDAAQTSSQVCREPATGLSLEPKSTPGYYPGFRTLDQQNYWDAATRKVVLDRVQDVPCCAFSNRMKQ